MTAALGHAASGRPNRQAHAQLKRSLPKLLLLLLLCPSSLSALALLTVPNLPPHLPTALPLAP